MQRRVELQRPKVVGFGLHGLAAHQIGVGQRLLDPGIARVEILGEQEFANGECHSIVADVVDPEVEVRIGSPQTQFLVGLVRRGGTAEPEEQHESAEPDHRHPQ